MKKPPFHKSVGFTIKGLMWILRNERNFQIEIFGLIINLFLIVLLKLNLFETSFILLSSFLVLIVEAINTCIEKLCDYLQPEFDPKIGVIKDVAAGAVLLSVIFAICVGFLVYGKYFWNFCQN